MPRVMTMDEDVDGFAAEYVLGTLNADERAEADALRLVDASFAAKVLEWERRLGELNVLVAPVEPSAAVDLNVVSLALLAPKPPPFDALGATSESGRPVVRIVMKHAAPFGLAIARARGQKQSRTAALAEP